MNQENFGKFIKEIRKQNNLTQKEFAEKYNVTYQAVSKWENGKNMPDMTLIKQMSKDFNISLDNLLEGKNKKNKNHKPLIIALFILLFIIIILLIINKDENFNFKTLSSACDNFNIAGNIAYNDKKSSIYITDIEYCGHENNQKYQEIECTLYEKNKDVVKKISSDVYKDKSIKLEDYLKTVTLTVPNYQKICKEYNENSLYLEIKAKANNEITSYNVPLSLKKCSTKS